MKRTQLPDVALKTQDLHKILGYLESCENVRPGSQELGTGYSLLYSTLGHVHHQHGLQGAGSDFGSGSGNNSGGSSGFQGCAGFVSNGVMSASTVNIASFGNYGSGGSGSGSGNGGGGGNNSTNSGGGGGSHGHGHGHGHNGNSNSARRLCTLPEDITTGVFSRSQTVSPHITLDNRAIRSILTRQKATQEQMREEAEHHDKNLFVGTAPLREEKEEGDDNNNNNNDDEDDEDDDESDEDEEKEEGENENEVREGEEGADEATKAALRKIRRACGCECKELVTLVLNNLGGAAFPDTISEVLFELPIISEYNASVANSSKKRRTTQQQQQQQQQQRKAKKALGREEVRLAVGFCLDRDRDAFVQYALGRERGRSFWVLGEYLLGFATEDELTEIRDHETPELMKIPLVAYEDMSFHSCSSVANSAKYDTLHGAVLRFLENESLYAAQDRAARGAGLSHEDDVVDFVLSNWCRPHRDITNDVLRREVLATLRTSPLFAQSLSCPGFWRPAPLAAQVLPKEWRFSQDVLSGRRPVRSARDGTTVAAASLSLATAIVITEREAQRQGKAFLPAAGGGGGGGGTNAGSASASSAQSGGKKHRPAPPVGSDGDSASSNYNNDGGNSGYGSPSINGCGSGDKDGDQGVGLRDEPRFLLCSRCGADIPGRGPCAGWKIGQHRNDVLCVACCVLVDITTSCMICGKQYSRGDDNSEDDVEDEGEDKWICCDGCHRWAMVRCDPSIRDINEYVETQVNPKKYFCPYCVHHKHQAQYFQFLAESSEKNNPSSLAMPADGCCSDGSGSAAAATAEPHEPCQKRARTLPDEEGCETDEYVEEAVAHFTDEVFPALLAENDRALTLEQKDEVAAFKDALTKKIRYVLREKVKAHNEQVRRLNTDLGTQISCALCDFECIFREHLEKSFATKQSTGYKR